MYIYTCIFLFYIFSPNAVASLFSNSFNGSYFAYICDPFFDIDIISGLFALRPEICAKVNYLTWRTNKNKTDRDFYQQAISELFLIMLHTAFLSRNFIVDSLTIEVVNISYLKEN